MSKPLFVRLTKKPVGASKDNRGASKDNRVVFLQVAHIRSFEAYGEDDLSTILYMVGEDVIFIVQESTYEICELIGGIV